MDEISHLDEKTIALNAWEDVLSREMGAKISSEKIDALVEAVNARIDEVKPTVDDPGQKHASILSPIINESGEITSYLTLHIYSGVTVKGLKPVKELRIEERYPSHGYSMGGGDVRINPCINGAERSISFIMLDPDNIHSPKVNYAHDVVKSAEFMKDFFEELNANGVNDFSEIEIPDLHNSVVYNIDGKPMNSPVILSDLSYSKENEVELVNFALKYGKTFDDLPPSYFDMQKSLDNELIKSQRHRELDLNQTNPFYEMTVLLGGALEKLQEANQDITEEALSKILSMQRDDLIKELSEISKFLNETIRGTEDFINDPEQIFQFVREHLENNELEPSLLIKFASKTIPLIHPLKPVDQIERANENTLIPDVQWAIDYSSVEPDLLGEIKEQILPESMVEKYNDRIRYVQYFAKSGERERMSPTVNEPGEQLAFLKSEKGKEAYILASLHLSAYDTNAEEFTELNSEIDDSLGFSVILDIDRYNKSLKIEDSVMINGESVVAESSQIKIKPRLDFTTEGKELVLKSSGFKGSGFDSPTKLELEYNGEKYVICAEGELFEEFKTSEKFIQNVSRTITDNLDRKIDIEATMQKNYAAFISRRNTYGTDFIGLEIVFAK